MLQAKSPQKQKYWSVSLTLLINFHALTKKSSCLNARDIPSAPHILWGGGGGGGGALEAGRGITILAEGFGTPPLPQVLPRGTIPGYRPDWGNPASLLQGMRPRKGPGTRDHGVLLPVNRHTSAETLPSPSFGCGR